jgi:hypothetical protein
VQRRGERAAERALGRDSVTLLNGGMQHEAGVGACRFEGLVVGTPLPESRGPTKGGFDRHHVLGEDPEGTIKVTGGEPGVELLNIPAQIGH